MAFLRLIKRSFHYKIPKLGPDESRLHTLSQLQQHCGLIHPKPLLIPTCSALYTNYQHFCSTTTTTTTTTTTNQINETTQRSSPLGYNGNDVTDTDDIDFWKDPTRRIKIEGRTADEVWEEYTRLLEDPTTELKECDYAIVCVSMKKDKTSVTSIKRIQMLLRHIHERGDMPNVFVRCCNMLIYLYLEHRDLDSARLVFDGLVRSKYRPSVVTVNTLLDGIAHHGTAKDALALYQALGRQDLFPNSVLTYQKLIKVLGSDFGDVDTSLALFNMLKENNDNNFPTPDIRLHNTVLHIYNQANQSERAWAFYQQTMMADDSGVTPDLATYYTLLTTLKGMKDDASKKTRSTMISDDMKRLGLKISASHYQAMGWDAVDVLSALEKDGQQPSVYDYNLLISSAVRNNKFGDALAMYQHMINGEGDSDNKAQQRSLRVTPDVYTYSIIMDVLVKDIEQPAAMVFDMYEDMKRHAVKPDVVIFSNLLQACARDNNVDRAMGFMEEMQKFNIQPNSYIINNFMYILSQKAVKAKSDMYTARALWDQSIAIGVYPDTRSFNHYLSLLSQYVPTVTRNEIKSARFLMQQDNHGQQQQQQRLDDLFDDDTRDNNISTGSIPMSGTAKYMMSIYRVMRHSKNKSSQPDFLSYSIMINTMMAQGQTRQAMLLFRDAQMSKKQLGVSIYNTIMQGSLQDNDLHQVMYMWQDMKANRVLPDRDTYDLVLDACEQLHLAESFTAIMKQRDSDSARLAWMDEAREKRWSRSKSFKAQQRQRQNLDDSYN